MTLNGPWDFAFDPEQRYASPIDVVQWPMKIIVPYPPESRASGIGDPGFHPSCWYRRTFYFRPGSQRLLLHFGAVDYCATVWLNGQHVARHEGGYTPFSADISFALNPSGEQEVIVRAEDPPQELTKPRGKQDWQLAPHSIWYPRITGIWQTVWLEAVPRTYIHRLRWTPHVDGFAISFEARLAGDRVADCDVEVDLFHGGRMLARDAYRAIDEEANRRIILSDPGIDDFRNEMLWSPERPTLLDAHIRLKQRGRVVDEVYSYTALRSVDISRDRFLLNGRPYMLRLVLDQGCWPDSLFAAPDDDALRCDVELAKRMGFNGVRKHQKIEVPRYLYWADKLGLLVWEEMPSAYRFTRTAINRLVREWTEAIDRDYSHPCVITWVPFNESWGVPDLPTVGAHRDAVQALYHLTKTLDPTRPVVGNDGWEASATDIIGIHDYNPSPQHMRSYYGKGASTAGLFDRRRPGGRVLTLDGYPHRGQPIMLSEFGGISLQARGASVQAGWGYSVVFSREELQNRYAELLSALADAPMFCGFCYTQFADCFQETNGLLTERREPKMPLDAIAAATRAPHGYGTGDL